MLSMQGIAVRTLVAIVRRVCHDPLPFLFIAVVACHVLLSMTTQCSRDLIVPRLESKLHVQERKKEMAKIIQATKKAHDAREHCLAEMSNLKAQVRAWRMFAPFRCFHTRTAAHCRVQSFHLHDVSLQDVLQ